MSLSQSGGNLLEKIAQQAYATLAAAYPVCSFSDEFYFFPQVVLADRDWSAWDDFSDTHVAETADAVHRFEQALAGIDSSALDNEEQCDLDLLQQMLRTVREQLTVISPQRTQPTFHLTVLAAGLAEALGCGDDQCWSLRSRGVAAFLQRAEQCLREVPEAFRKLGLEMLSDLQVWLGGLREERDGVASILAALAHFKGALKSLPTVDSCCLPEEQFETMLRVHLGCGLGVDELLPILKGELAEMEALLATETGRLQPGLCWLEAEQKIPFVTAPGKDLRQLYLQELRQMESHCLQSGLVPAELAVGNLAVLPVPDYLSAIRASDAYTAIPGMPPQGGIFYVMAAGHSLNGQVGRSLEYRMTAVHEAWPGHHLLDSCRWGLARPIRKPLESPLFYEGWACLAEELMAQTGYLNGPWDRFLLAKRRAERAVRGLIDIGMQSGRMTEAQACELLARVGYRHSHAQSVVAKYLLRPGYQVCYTLGLKQGLDLLDSFGRRDPGGFARTLLQQGEIGFPRLAEVFRSGRDQGV